MLFCLKPVYVWEKKKQPQINAILFGTYMCENRKNAVADKHYFVWNLYVWEKKEKTQINGILFGTYICEDTKSKTDAWNTWIKMQDNDCCDHLPQTARCGECLVPIKLSMIIHLTFDNNSS